MEGLICGPNDEDSHPPPTSLVKRLFKQMKTATQELTKEIVDLGQKKVEIETELDLITTFQFGILQEVAEVKQATGTNPR
ncbi:hypothetical protein Y032_0007g3334 [Ancylostoma ceylanicum]|uniref:Uncharacterized protein n=1 Tax=Ancylostoma ceylanicum TaxID=53326 RepID=A0A016VPH5_9BILA|nr:hypothetical protein Y032_0007g3334 [Ancylostoma ceylanicum]